jgi:hypothetical protein
MFESPGQTGGRSIFFGTGRQTVEDRLRFESIGRTMEGSPYFESGTVGSQRFFDLGDRDSLLTADSATRPGTGDYLPRNVPPLALPTTIQQQDVVSRVTAIRDLMQKEQISAARRLLEMIPIGTPEEAAVARLRRALTPPTVRPSGRKDTERHHAYQWLLRHGHEHKGQWVAVGEGGLIASAPTLKALREQLRALAPAEQPLIHKL